MSMNEFQIKNASESYQSFTVQVEDHDWVGYVVKDVKDTGDRSEVTYFNSIVGYEVVWVSEKLRVAASSRGLSESCRI